MSIAFSEDELNLLYYLYARRCLSAKHSKNVLAIERDLGEKMNVGEVLQSLQNKQYIGCKKKKEKHYWALAGKTIRILEVNGYPISRGGQFRLE